MKSGRMVEKIRQVSEDHFKLINHSKTFNNRILKEYDVSLSCNGHNTIILKSDDTNKIDKLVEEVFEEKGQIKILRVPIETEYVDVLIENKSDLDITDNVFIKEVEATVHYVFNDDENAVYIVSNAKDISLSKYMFTSEFKDLILQKKDTALKEKDTAIKEKEKQLLKERMKNIVDNFELTKRDIPDNIIEEINHHPPLVKEIQKYLKWGKLY